MTSAREVIPVKEYARLAQRSKYRARPTWVEGIRFASKREADRYCELRLLEAAGKIRELECQVRYPLVVNGIRVSTYVADFVYIEWPKLGHTVEDCKGYRTPLYKLKRRLFEALYDPLTILET